MSIRQLLAAGACAALVIGSAAAQEYPIKPIRMHAAAAGGPDFAARVIAPAISVPLGQQVVVENRPVIQAVEFVLKAPADGYNLLIVSNPFFVTPLLQEMRYDPVNDFLPVTLVSREQNILVIHPSLPVKSVKEIIALAKSKPGALNYGSGSTGSSTHFAGELFNFIAGTKIIRIPYKGGGQAVIDLLGGHVQMMFATPASIAPHIKSGRLKALALTGTQRSALLPELPTVAATGLPGYEIVGLDGVFAVAKTPAAIINRLNQEFVRYMRTPEARDKFLAAGTEIQPSTPDELMSAMKSDIAKYGKLIKSVGIKADN
jgi:tripartite-type tricarboxylate transporter receptor subunit TctC